jgi:Fe2+ transport system protein FeoA
METSLIALGLGKPAEIKRIQGGRGFQRRVESLGIRVGKTVRKIAEQPLRGPVVLELDGCRIALGRGMAAKIIVEEVKE